jgi:hypothetical protein
MLSSGMVGRLLILMVGLSSSVSIFAAPVMFVGNVIVVVDRSRCAVAVV